MLIIIQQVDVLGALSSDVEDHSKHVENLLKDSGTPAQEFLVYTELMEGAVINGPFRTDERHTVDLQLLHVVRRLPPVRRKLDKYDDVYKNHIARQHQKGQEWFKKLIKNRGEYHEEPAETAWLMEQKIKGEAESELRALHVQMMDNVSRSAAEQLDQDSEDMERVWFDEARDTCLGCEFGVCDGDSPPGHFPDPPPWVCDTCGEQICLHCWYRKTHNFISCGAKHCKLIVKEPGFASSAGKG